MAGWPIHDQMPGLGLPHGLGSYEASTPLLTPTLGAELTKELLNHPELWEEAHGGAIHVQELQTAAFQRVHV